MCVSSCKNMRACVGASSKIFQATQSSSPSLKRVTDCRIMVWHENDSMTSGKVVLMSTPSLSYLLAIAV